MADSICFTHSCSCCRRAAVSHFQIVVFASSAACIVASLIILFVCSRCCAHRVQSSPLPDDSANDPSDEGDPSNNGDTMSKNDAASFVIKPTAPPAQEATSPDHIALSLHSNPPSAPPAEGAGVVLNPADTVGAHAVGAVAVERRKHAFCVGIAKYTHIGALSNPENDANDVAEALRELKYDVDVVLSPTRDMLIHRCKDFLGKVTSGSTVVVFLAGHGKSVRVAVRVEKRFQGSHASTVPSLQVQGMNYLLPADFGAGKSVNAESAFCYQRQLLDELERIEAGLKAILVDTCRTSQYLPGIEPAARVRDGEVESGPQPLRLPLNTIVGMACNVGMTASDGLGRSRNGLYTMALLMHIRSRLPINKLLTNVNAEVDKLVKVNPKTMRGVQISSVVSSLLDSDATIY
jgi:hypothetical protein